MMSRRSAADDYLFTFLTGERVWQVREKPISVWRVTQEIKATKKINLRKFSKTHLRNSENLRKQKR